MLLQGFGHGVAIGVEPGTGKDAGSSFLWTETHGKLQPNSTDTDLYGTKICRFKFAKDTTLTYGQLDDSVDVFDPRPGSTNTSCTVDAATDPANPRLIYRYHDSNLNNPKFDIYWLADAKVGNFDNPLLDGFRQPDVLYRYGMRRASTTSPWKPYDYDGWFQGYAAYGHHLYILDGNGWNECLDSEGDIPPSPKYVGNTYISCIDLNTGCLVEQFRSPDATARERVAREPQGMAVGSGGPDGQPRLGYGFGINDDPRKVAIYYKTQLVD